MTIDEAYKFVSYVSNKTQRGNLKPNDFNILAPRAQMDLFMQRYGNPMEYQYGRPMPRVAWQMTQKITDDMKAFVTKYMANIPDDGELLYPSDYAHLSSARGIYIETSVSTEAPETFEVKLEPVNDNEIGDYLFSYVNKPSKRRPIIAFYDKYMQVYPKDITSVVVTYLRYPKVPVWGSIVATGATNPSYNPATSVNFEMPEDTHSEICYRILSYLGINLRDSTLTQYAEALKKTGGV